MTSVIVTHEVEELFALCDLVMMIHEGRLVALDTPEALRQSDNPLVRQFVDGLAEGPIAV
jgi:phospholipid/cholesterol/gamma-HCH transport system ATP-binding protein